MLVSLCEHGTVHVQTTDHHIDLDDIEHRANKELLFFHNKLIKKITHTSIVAE